MKTSSSSRTPGEAMNSLSVLLTEFPSTLAIAAGLTMLIVFHLDTTINVNKKDRRKMKLKSRVRNLVLAIAVGVLVYAMLQIFIAASDAIPPTILTGIPPF